MQYNPWLSYCQVLKQFLWKEYKYGKTKRITLNADKRKVIADVFQDHFESNSKFKKSWTEAKETYNNLREQAKVKINELVRFHQPQEDVDTIRGMISKYGQSGGDLYHDNCFYVQTDTPNIEENYRGEKRKIWWCSYQVW